MLRLATDADVARAIIRGIRRHAPGIDLIHCLEVFPEGTPDAEILAWAAAENRTNDRATMIGFANRRAAAGEPMPGLIIASKKQAVGKAVEDILIIAECLSEDEIRDQLMFLPL